MPAESAQRWWRPAPLLALRVVVAELTPDKAQEAAAKYNAPDQVIGVAMNITKPETLPPALDDVEQQFGVVDVLINAAGTHIEQAAEDVTPEARKSSLMSISRARS